MSAYGLLKFPNDQLLICPDSGERMSVVCTLSAITNNKSVHKKLISFVGTPLYIRSCILQKLTW